jgi:hypothetical protein
VLSVTPSYLHKSIILEKVKNNFKFNFVPVSVDLLIHILQYYFGKTYLASVSKPCRLS